MASRSLTSKITVSPIARTAYVRFASTESSAQKLAKGVDQAKASVSAEKLSDATHKVAQQVKELDLGARAQAFARALQNAYKSTVNALPKGIVAPVAKVGGVFQPLVYWSQVTFHIGKQVACRQQFVFPKSQDFIAAQSEFFNLLSKLSSKNISSVKDLPLSCFKKGALITFELASFFIVGEQIGRRSLIGYKNH
ncbi:hypothetical protein EV182_001502 [Spiromyces aspiralis]|uniref:Uncharacterized protein n=1 Tax=Spiromyces aspiralis TaxID=68401 RepID=A0ACC1HGJ9_9FUNG|nr:hypothetical protein EV182_001502 [Spiromyces aspiralis]